MMRLIYISLLFLSFNSCKSQTDVNQGQIVGGRCEGCEAIYEFRDKVLLPIDTLPDFLETKPKIKITGTVFKRDGETPAKNVILYIYHTNRAGLYKPGDTATGWENRHGYIRGWIKTEKDGKYTFYTIRPASYPNSEVPEHIHFIVKEPDKNEYYIDDIVFSDDPKLTKAEMTALKNRGGSGIVTPEIYKGIKTVERNIILGLNIPDYY